MTDGARGEVHIDGLWILVRFDLSVLRCILLYLVRNIIPFELGFALCTSTGSPHTIIIRWKCLAAPLC